MSVGNVSTQDQEDDVSIARAIEQLYAVISFEQGSDPNWDGLRTILSPHARITRITPEGTDYLDAGGSGGRSSHARSGVLPVHQHVPAVPVNKPSVRFTISRHNSLGDIREMVDALAESADRPSADERSPSGEAGALRVG